MTFTAEQLAAAVRSTHDLFTRYLTGFDDTNATKQAPHLPNHAVWILGHLALTMHRAAELIAGETFTLDWDSEPFAFGSHPTDSPQDYPPLAELIARYDTALDRLATVIAQCSDADLQREIKWSRFSVTARDLAVRMVFHNGTHCGQLIDLRRALALPGIF